MCYLPHKKPKNWSLIQFLNVPENPLKYSSPNFVMNRHERARSFDTFDTFDTFQEVSV